MAKSKRLKLTVGRSEYIDLPEWGIRQLLAKVDTGARTSALHVEELKKLPGNRVSFQVVRSRSNHLKAVRVVADVVKWSRVRSSNGSYSLRCFVRTRAVMGPVEKDIEFSLDSRADMNYRMLLGRKALAGDFVVDVSKQHGLKTSTKKARKRVKRAVDESE